MAERKPYPLIVLNRFGIQVLDVCLRKVSSKSISIQYLKATVRRGWGLTGSSILSAKIKAVDATAYVLNHGCMWIEIEPHSHSEGYAGQGKSLFAVPSIKFRAPYEYQSHDILGCKA